MPTTILRIEGAFCTFELIAGIGTFRDTPEALEARPSDETTRLTTRPFPVEGATGGLGACLLDEDGLKAEVETGLLWCLGIFSGGPCCWTPLGGLELSSVTSPSDMDTLGPAEGDNRVVRDPLSKTGAGLVGLGGN